MTGLTNPPDISVSTAVDTVAGNYLVVFLFGFGIFGSLTDSQGNTYSFNVIGNGSVTEYHCNGCAGGPLTITFTFGGAPPWAGIAVAEYGNATMNINDQLYFTGVQPLGNSVGEFSQCPDPGLPNTYLATNGAGDISATYSWPPSWSPSTNYGGSGGTLGTALYVPNTLNPVTLEGALGNGNSGVTPPAWVFGGATIDNTVTWNDSGIVPPGPSLVVLGVMADQAGAFSLSGWTLRTTMTDGSGQNSVAIYERGPNPFFTTYSVAVTKVVDTFDLAAQLSHVTAFPFVIPTAPLEALKGQYPPRFSLPFSCKEKSCHRFPFQ